MHHAIEHIHTLEHRLIFFLPSHLSLLRQLHNRLDVLMVKHTRHTTLPVLTTLAAVTAVLIVIAARSGRAGGAGGAAEGGRGSAAGLQRRGVDGWERACAEAEA